jgi:putative nucleotidyltransferase with HDIG domain
MIVVTGIGIVSALGIGVQENYASLKSQKSGLENIKNFQTTHNVPAGEVKYTNSQLKALLNLRESKTYSRTTLLGMLAAREAVQSANIGTGRVGLISATSVGGMDLTEVFYPSFEQGVTLDKVVHHDSADSTIHIAKDLKIENLTYQSLETLASTIDAKDKYTNGHSNRVANYSREIARRMGKDEAEIIAIYFMGLLHDIGKIGIRDDIINKTSRLTDEEFMVIKNHPTIGYNILKNMTEIPNIEYGARWHHERYDGKGYPDGLKGEQIPEYARIICVADSYDAMTSTRSYRAVMPQEKVRNEIENCKGKQFDPIIAQIMIEMIDEDINYTMKEK